MGLGRQEEQDEEIVMRDATNQSDDLLIRDSDSSQDGGEEQDTVGELSKSVRSTLFDEHLLPTKTSQRAS